MTRKFNTPRLRPSSAFLLLVVSMSLVFPGGCTSGSRTYIQPEGKVAITSTYESNVSFCSWNDSDTVPLPPDVYPEMISAPELQYPKLARTAGLQGTVKLKVLVCEEGNIGGLKVIESSGIASLDEAAMHQARGCKYEPAMRNGAPIKCWVIYDVKFKLDGLKDEQENEFK